jgi:hypothetical protein
MAITQIGVVRQVLHLLQLRARSQGINGQTLQDWSAFFAKYAEMT